LIKDVDRSLNHCADVTGTFFVPGLGKKACWYFATATRLKFCKSKPIVASKCPETCDLCCVDNTQQFTIGTKNRKCIQGVKFPNLCNNSLFSHNCPVTCKTCGSPTASPTFSPTAPTLSPTFSPTMSPTFQCKDKSGLVSLPKFNFTKKNCWQIKQAPKFCKDIVGREHCRVTCKNCLCEDATGSFKVGTKWRKCVNSQRFLCKNSLYRNKCPVLCDNCPWPPTAAPTESPTDAPTESPTRPPTESPTTSPPTESPTEGFDDDRMSMSYSMSMSLSMSYSMSMSLSMSMR
jgi:hypothetical protein